MRRQKTRLEKLVLFESKSVVNQKSSSDAIQKGTNKSRWQVGIDSKIRNTLGTTQNEKKRMSLWMDGKSDIRILRKLSKIDENFFFTFKK